MREQEKQKPEKYLFQEGKDIVKELPLSRFELPLHAGITVLAIVLFFLGRMEIVAKAQGTAVLVLLIFAWGLYLFKWKFFYPRSKKVLVMRIFKNSGIQLSAENIKHDKLVHFDKNDDTPPVSIDRINKHFEVSTGRPIVVCMEEKSKNLDLLKATQADREAKEYNNIVKTTWGTAWQACMNNMLKFKNQIKDPMFIVTIIVLLAVIATIVLSISNASTLSKIAEATGALQSGA